MVILTHTARSPIHVYICIPKIHRRAQANTGKLRKYLEPQHATLFNLLQTLCTCTGKPNKYFAQQLRSSLLSQRYSAWQKLLKRNKKRKLVVSFCLASVRYFKHDFKIKGKLKHSLKFCLCLSSVFTKLILINSSFDFHLK